MKESDREIVEGTIYQGVNESVAYSITTTVVGSSPTSVSFKIYSVDTQGIETDVTATLAAGSATVSGDIITLPKLSGVSNRGSYRIAVKFTSGGNVYEHYARLIGAL